MTTVPLEQLPGRPCPIAATLELVGERWSLLVVREIAMGSVRFSDIVRGTGAPRDRIAARLKSLEAAGVIQCELSPGARRHTYGLTASGADLLPALNALLAWGERHAVAADDPQRAARYRTLVEPEEIN
ncbi:winged helix-turn-helix transcriptional regulator [Tomitella biformata]|uniref:winged helix-turn-helix transcriptional regulator n=1 Tax=Tomitella biformata TaxID=630403 RepID=UPI000466F17E|nr:helix-turn-helix domain-containing protein [Tomitella biformata]